QLVGGAYEQEQVRLEDPVAVARDWARHGFTHLHVVDLDAATGRGSNAAVIEEILRDGQLVVQVGGGVRSEERVEALLELVPRASWWARARSSSPTGSRRSPRATPACWWWPRT